MGCCCSRGPRDEGRVETIGIRELKDITGQEEEEKEGKVQTWKMMRAV